MPFKSTSIEEALDRLRGAVAEGGEGGERESVAEAGQAVRPDFWNGAQPLSPAALILQPILEGSKPQMNYFIYLCRMDKLEADTGHFIAVAEEQGKWLTEEEIRDALLELAAALAPQSAAGRRDVRRELFRTSLTFLADTLPEAGGTLDAAFEELEQGLADVWPDKDLPTFRKFLREKLRGILQKGAA